MAFTINNSGTQVNSLPVPYSIMWDSGIGLQEANPETGPQATVKFRCKWDDRYPLVQGLLGLWTGTPPSNIVYTGPFNYPPSPNLLCTAVSAIRPFGKPYFNFLNYLGVPLNTAGYKGWMAAKEAIVVAHFTRPPWVPLSTGGYFSIHFDGAGEFLTLPDTTYQFADGTPDNTNVGMFLPEAQVTVRRYRIPFLPDQYMVALCASLNNGPFQIGYTVYPQGSLLFMPGHSTIEPDPLGNITYGADYVFMFRTIDWNYDFHPNRTTGWALVTDGNGNPRYPYNNFNILP